MSNKISEILPHLYIGSYKDAFNLAELSNLGITHILNVMESARSDDDTSIVRLHIAVSDFGDTALNGILDRCCDFIEGARKQGGKVLLHCGRGQNRSPSVATAYLMQTQRLTLREAFHHVRLKRPQFAPHEAYLKQLQEIELQLFGSISLTEEEEPLSVQAIAREIALQLKERTT